MSTPQGDPVTLSNWLTARGENRLRALESAAATLLEPYLACWPRYVPVELHRLAWSRGARVVDSAKDVTDGAKLLPWDGRFEIVLGANLPRARRRAAIAHELAHTLFYSSPAAGSPRRIVDWTPREETFCFDVARRVLAPVRHLKELGVDETSDPLWIFSRLTRTLLLSKSMAAQVMLQDYRLARGVAGRWRREEGEWRLMPGAAWASPALRASVRREYHQIARRWLDHGPDSVAALRTTGVVDEERGHAFVLVARPVLAHR